MLYSARIVCTYGRHVGLSDETMTNEIEAGNTYKKRTHYVPCIPNIFLRHKPKNSPFLVETVEEAASARE